MPLPVTPPTFSTFISSKLSNPGTDDGSFRNPSSTSKKVQKQEREWLGVSFKPENFIPGLIIGFIFGFFLDLSKPPKTSGGKKVGGSLLGRNHQQPRSMSTNGDEELKMVLVVRQDLKMGSGKVASQCAHAATGIYSELMYSHRSLLRQWETLWATKNSCYMQESARNVSRNKLKDAAESIGLPTFTVADAGRTQVSAGSKTVLAIGPGVFIQSFVISPLAHFPPFYLHSWPLPQMVALQSLLPLHTAVSSARLTSCLGADATGCRSLSQGMLCSANPGV
ncbi:UNVERIFIED_CONTAM: putative peptidyl-tRNA hydrolase 2 [Sesamum calycinum]|uniref:peptidyl-tRNA hydrolase n=1 Tax=Sesamum calycinum TaxID=2727403 RepID=A0AAW2QWE3_9LAMI